MPERPSSASQTLLPATAKTATASSGPVDGKWHRGAHVQIVVTVLTAGASIVPTVEGYNDLSASWYTILAGAAVTATGTTTLKVYPGITAVTNVSVSDVLPASWRLTMTAADAKSVTYSAVANLVR